ncbi:hypothetical protein U1Q18_028837 [Sarracenia purpurea var. burkii]
MELELFVANQIKKKSKWNSKSDKQSETRTRRKIKKSNKNQMIRGRGRAARETALGGAGEESKGVKDDGGDGFDLRLREAAEENVLYGGDAD